MYSISKEFNFEYSHRLYKLVGSPCNNIHGHSGKIIVTIETDFLNDTDMVLDFSELKWFQEWLNKNWDHAIILNNNDPILEYCTKNAYKQFVINNDPTSEILARIVWDKIAHHINDLAINWNKLSITFYETAKNYATYSNTYTTI